VAKASDNVFPKLIGAVQGSNPTTPAAGQRKLYAKADGWYDIDAAGTVTGPLGAGGGTGGGGAWTAYTPTWTSNGTAPAIGNGTITAAYTQIGKTVHFRMDFTFGSTTTFGSGTAYRFSLPVAAKALSTNHGINVGGYFEDAGVTAYAPVGARMASGSTTNFELLHVSGTGGGAGVISPSTPFAWGNGDFIRIYGTYEAA
jgi:hypothetical protein